MVIKLNHHPETEEPQDALDHLIINELGQQARWRGIMQEWDMQQRRRRRLRLLPVMSNIASVAALMILGFILQAFLPKTQLVDSTAASQAVPVMEQLVTPSDTAEISH